MGYTSINDEHYDEDFYRASHARVWRDDVKDWVRAQAAMQTNLVKAQMEASYRQQFGDDAPDIDWAYFKPEFLKDIINDCLPWEDYES